MQLVISHIKDAHGLMFTAVKSSYTPGRGADNAL